MTMTKPIPFCPSFLPWKNETSVQVKIKMDLIQSGGGEFFLGSLNISLFEMVFFKIYIKMIAKEKPNNGERKSACPISMTLSQLTDDMSLFEFSGNKA
jgi:hypothetical protein